MRYFFTYIILCHILYVQKIYSHFREYSVSFCAVTHSNKWYMFRRGEYDAVQSHTDNAITSVICSECLFDGLGNTHAG